MRRKLADIITKTAIEIKIFLKNILNPLNSKFSQIMFEGEGALYALSRYVSLNFLFLFVQHLNGLNSFLAF